MAKQKPVAQVVPQPVNLELITGRVKKDMVWVLISVVVSIGAGLIIGNFFKF